MAGASLIMVHALRYGLAVGSAACMMALSPANAQEALDNDRLERIENAIADLQAVLYSAEGQTAQTPPPIVYGTAPDGTSGASYGATAGNDLAFRMDLIEREIQTLTGRIEQIAYAQELNGRRLDTLAEALNLSFAGQAKPIPPLTPPDAADGPPPPVGRPVGAPYAAPFQPDNTKPVVPPDQHMTATANDTGGASATNTNVDARPTLAPDALFERGYTAMLKGEYAAAGKDFKRFLAEYPNDPQAPEAQFRLGEVYLAIGDNAAAARAFYDHAKKWPNNKRAAETYMRLGIAFARAGKKAEACKILKALPSKFTNLDASQQDRLALAKEEAGC